MLPGLFVAARLDRLTFSELITGGIARSWEAPVTRVEAALGMTCAGICLRRAFFNGICGKAGWYGGWGSSPSSSSFGSKTMSGTPPSCRAVLFLTALGIGSLGLLTGSGAAGMQPGPAGGTVIRGRVDMYAGRFARLSAALPLAISGCPCPTT